MRKFRFIGSKKQSDDYCYDNKPVLGRVYCAEDMLDHDGTTPVEEFAVLFPSEWAEVVEEALETTTKKLYTLDEVVDAVNNWAMVGVIGGDDVAGFFARREKQIKLNKIKELEEELKKLKETL